MNKIYIVFNTFSTPSDEIPNGIKIREEVEEVFDNREKAVKYVQQCMLEAIDNSSVFEELGCRVFIDWVPDVDLIKENAMNVVAKNDHGCVVGIMYRSYDLN